MQIQVTNTLCDFCGRSGGEEPCDMESANRPRKWFSCYNDMGLEFHICTTCTKAIFKAEEFDLVEKIRGGYSTYLKYLERFEPPFPNYKQET